MNFFKKICILTTVAMIPLCSYAAGGVKGAGDKGDTSIVKQADGSLLVNTTSFASDIRGFKGPTPLEIVFKKGKIVSVKPLKNLETPNFFKKLTNTGFFNKWDGVPVKKVKTMHVDAVTGATFSSKAVIETVKRAAEKVEKRK